MRVLYDQLLLFCARLKNEMEIFASALFHSVESRRHRISNNVKSNQEIRNFKWHFHQRLHQEDCTDTTCRLKEKQTCSLHINLLYVEDDNLGHFAFIKNLSRLNSSNKIAWITNLAENNIRNISVIGTWKFFHIIIIIIIIIIILIIIIINLRFFSDACTTSARTQNWRFTVRTVENWTIVR